MRLSQLVLRNALRSPTRASMTVVTVALMLVAFVFPRALVEAQRSQVRAAPDNRVITQPKVGWGGGLPLRYAEEIRGLPGISRAAGSQWAGFKLPAKDEVFFASFAIESERFLAMHHEIVASAAQKQAFIEDDHGAMVSNDLAEQMGWKEGDRLVLQSRDLPGEWAVNVACIYEPVGGEWAKRSLWVHHTYFNRTLPVESRDTLSFVAVEVLEPNRGGEVAKAIDLRFDASPVRTLSLEDRVQTAASIGRFSAVLTAMDLVSYLILFVVFSIFANTLSMNVRERTRELGVLRAIGYGPGRVCALIIAEAALLGFTGSVLGVGLSWVVVQELLGRILEETFQLPEVTVPLGVSLSAVAAGVTLAICSAALPAARLVRLEVTASLGRVT
jgi:putative ABC transport system permease protein